MMFLDPEYHMDVDRWRLPDGREAQRLSGLPLNRGEMIRNYFPDGYASRVEVHEPKTKSRKGWRNYAVKRKAVEEPTEDKRPIGEGKLRRGITTREPSSTTIPWDDERWERCQELYRMGLKAAEIAAQLGGVSRNAILGKLWRAGLRGR